MELYKLNGVSDNCMHKDTASIEDDLVEVILGPQCRAKAVATNILTWSQIEVKWKNLII